MKTTIPGVYRKVAKQRGDKRPGSLKGGMPLSVHRSAAQRRAGILNYKRRGQGSHTVPPK